MNQLPPGFHEVTVILTSRELQEFRRKRSLTPGGSYSEAIRWAMGRTYSPHGLKTALKRMQTETES